MAGGNIHLSRGNIVQGVTVGVMAGVMAGSNVQGNVLFPNFGATGAKDVYIGILVECNTDDLDC